MKDCIFCKIVKGEIPAEKIFENESVIAIKDLYPQAKSHYLVVPKNHLANLTEADETLSGKLLSAGVEVAKRQGLMPDGFRSVINTNKNGGQTVFHLHLHILGGEQLKGGFGA